MNSLASGAAFVRPKSGIILPYILIAFGFSWAVWMATWWGAGRPSSFDSTPLVIAVYVGSFGPGIAGAIMSAREGRFREWISGFARWRMGWKGVAAITLPLPLGVLALTLALGYAPVPQKGVPSALFFATIFPAVVLNGMATAIMGAGPLGEEGGWRGYLLPRLLDRMGEIPASLLIGVVWSAWHLPVMVMVPEWRDGHSLAFYLPAYTVTVIGLSLLMTRIWLLARRSTLAAIWMHGVINALGSIAFNAKLWGGDWSSEANLLHYTAAIWIAAIVLHFVRPRDEPHPVD